MLAILMIQAAHPVPFVTAPPALRVIDTPSPSAGAQSIVAIDVRGEGKTLWQGDIRVGPSAQSSIRQMQSEPAGSTCGGDGGYQASLETGLSITLQPLRYPGNDDRMRVTVRWMRVDSADCPISSKTRAAEINATVDLSGKAPVVLEGDGGLSVRLRSRD